MTSNEISTFDFKKSDWKLELFLMKHFEAMFLGMVTEKSCNLWFFLLPFLHLHSCFYAFLVCYFPHYSSVVYVCWIRTGADLVNFKYYVRSNNISTFDFNKSDWRLELFLIEPFETNVQIRVYCPPIHLT